MAYEKEKSESYALIGGINSKASPYDNTIEEFRDLTNMNFVAPGALTKRPGSTLYAGATVAGRITGGYEFERLSGSSYLVVTANTNAYTLTPSGFAAFKTGLLNNAVFDFVTFVDRLFAGNGQDFFKYDGSNSTKYSLPAGASGWGVTTTTGGLSGIFLASWGYLNDRGYLGPAAPGITITLAGEGIKYYGLTSLSGFGITSIALYRSTPTGPDLFGTTFTSASNNTVTDPGWPLTNVLANDNLYFTLVPQFLEIYNNQLFLAGFSSQASTVYWSDIGEPEGVPPEFFAEFRTNDGDRISGMKSYNSALIVTKQRSIHRLTGDDPTNFLLQQISDQYGCLSNRSMVTYEDFLLFLDTNGIVQFDGANIRVISNKVEPIFKAMNIDAAVNNAVGFHYRDYHEVWFAIPCNGATLNNCIVVYDYLTDAWTKYEGIAASAVFLARGALDKKTPFYGGYSGNVSSFGASFYGDNGNAITCVIDTRFLSQRGQTTESQYRRFYLDVVPALGVTQPISVGFSSNFGDSVVVQRTMYQAPFQSRIDFGIPAKSIQAHVEHSSSTLGFQVSGYTFESRYQRST